MSWLSGVKSFVVEKFWTPIANESVFYNPFNTAVYAALGALGAAYLVFPLLKKLDVEFDRDFFLSVSPYIFLGGAARSLKDVNLLNTVLLETPFIYFLLFGVTASALFISRKVEERLQTPYYKIFGGFGAVLLALTLSQYTVSNFTALLAVLTAFGAVTAGVVLGIREFVPQLDSPYFYVPVLAHYFDAITSSVAVHFGASEKHVLGQFFVEQLGLLGVPVMKTLIVVPATFYIYAEIEDEEQKRYYLFIIALLGLALGTRNIISTVVA